MKEYEFIKNFIENLTELSTRKKIKKLKVSYKDFKVSIDMVGENVNMVDKFSYLSKDYEETKKQENIASFEDEKPEVKDLSSEGNVIVSPIVGTFYSSPSPTKPPFVKVGDKVKKGDILFIIESMKLMNEIKSEFDCVVKEILVKSGDGVEYAQPIMVVEKNN